MRLIRKTSNKLLTISLLLLLAINGGSAAALTSADLKSIRDNTSFYGEEEENTCSTVSGLSTGTLPGGVPEPYNRIITAAAEKYDASAALVAAVLYWENRGFPDPDKEWATSSAGAQGPMQFMPETFDAYGVDGDGDTKINVNDIDDAIFSGARYIAANGGKTDVPLGTLDKPLAGNTLLRTAASYNAGGGTVQDWGPDASLDDLYEETRDYVKAVFVLISSNFTKSPLSGSGLGGGDESSVQSTNPEPDDCAKSTSGGIDGTGSGKFIDNTDITIPGAAEAITKAQAIAKYSTSQLQAICDGSPNCYARCERLAAVVWGRESSGYYTANDHWNTMNSAGKAHPGDRNVPPGALLYYDTGSSAGHVATYLGNNLVLSNDVKDSVSGIKGGAYIVDAKDLEGGLWSLRYLGWVNPVPWM